MNQHHLCGPLVAWLRVAPCLRRLGCRCPAWHDAGLLTTDGPVKNVRVAVAVAGWASSLHASFHLNSSHAQSSLLRPSTMMFVMAAAFLALLVAATPESACAYHAAISASPKRAAPVAAFVTRPFGGASTSMRRCSSAGSTVLSLASSDEDGYPMVLSGEGRVSRRKRAVPRLGPLASF